MASKNWKIKIITFTKTGKISDTNYQATTLRKNEKLSDTNYCANSHWQQTRIDRIMPW